MRTRPGPRLTAVLARLGVLAVLVAAAIGLRASSPMDASDDGWRSEQLIQSGLRVAALVTLVWLVATLLLAPFAARDLGGPPRIRRRQNVFVSMIILAGFVMVAVLWDRLWSTDRPGAGSSATPTPATDEAVSGAGSDGGNTALLVVLLLVAVGAAALAGRRRRTTPEAADQELSAVSEGLAAAARVLRDRSDEPPRERVVAAYEAFEVALAARGVARGPSGTPSALLARAVEDGAPAEEASLLTDLFGAARFGVEPVTETQVERAERALEVLLASR